MKKLLMTLTFSLVFVVGCETNKYHIEVDPVAREQQTRALGVAEAELAQGNYKKAADSFKKFQRDYPTAYVYQKASIGYAQALEGQGEWAEACRVYPTVVDATRDKQPEFAALALYLSSYCYEVLGEEAKVAASLKDALAMEKYLTPEQAKAELPARLAAFYQREGQATEAAKYLTRAEEGLKQVRVLKGNALGPDWLAKTLFLMGSMTTNQLSHENIMAHIESLKTLQSFLLRSIEAQGVPWSSRALANLKGSYMALWNTIQSYPANEALDRGAAEREKLERQLYFVGELLVAMNELKSIPLTEPNEKNEQMRELSEFMGKLEERSREFLFNRNEITPLTQEALSRMGLKRSTEPDPYFYSDKAPENVPAQLPQKKGLK